MRTSAKVVLLVVVTGAVARADDGFKWNPAERREARVGERFREDLEKTNSRTVTLQVEGRPDEKREQSEEKIRLVHTIAAATSAAVTEDRIKVERWSLAAGKGEPDTSLEGATVTITGEGAFRGFTADGEKPVTRDAKRWIQAHLVKNGKRDPALDELDWDFILPKEPVADGGTWTIDPTAFAREVLGPQTSIDAKKSQGSGKLTNVRVESGAHVGRVEVTVSLALETLGTSPVTWKKGGVQEFRYALDLSLEPRRRDFVKGEITMELSGEGSVDLNELSLDWKARLKVERSPVD